MSSDLTPVHILAAGPEPVPGVAAASCGTRPGEVAADHVAAALAVVAQRRPVAARFRTASLADVAAVVELFDSVVSSHSAYISHSELMLGIADDPFTLNDRRLDIWRDDVVALLSEQPDHACALVLDRDGGPGIDAFALCQITRDSAVPYATLSDVCVRPSTRGHGVGSAFVMAVIEYATRAGAVNLFLESGIRNHAAHDVFEHLGFTKVSSVFMCPLSAA